MARACERCQYENTDEARFCLQCGAMLDTTSAASPGDPLIGRVLMHRYRINSVLGEGGMGKVYLAEQKMGTALRKVAIKTLHPELSGDPQLVARFHRECETVIELHHPNTVKFYDFGELEDKTLFIVMEHIEGGDLSHRLRDHGALSPQLADKLLVQICGSLHEAHERGVVHRDLKPENVLLTTRGGQSDFVKVLDFGIAKRSEAEDESTAKLTKQGMVLGTPPYMSPEQFSGQTLDLRSDIYSLGVMTYEMVTGVLPFEARTPWEWATKHLTVQPTPIESHPAGATLPENKRHAIMRALSKTPGERQDNALMFMHEFTGMGDPQVAWTMATSSGIADAGSSSGITPVPPPETAPIASPTPTPVPAIAHGNHTPAPTDFASHSGEIPGARSSRPLALLGLLGVVALAAIGGGVWMMMRPSEVATSDNNNTPPQNPALNPPLNPTMDPTTPTDVTNMDPTPAMDPTPMVELGTPIAPGMNPTMVPVQMDPTPMNPPPQMNSEMVEMTAEMVTPMTEPDMDTSEMSTMSQMGRVVSPANRQRANEVLRIAEAQARGGDAMAAARSLAQAQALVGRRDAGVARVRRTLTQIGGNVTGIMIMQGRCAQARSLVSALRRVRADSVARNQFGDACEGH